MVFTPLYLFNIIISFLIQSQLFCHWYTIEVRVQFADGRFSPWSNRVQFLTLTRPNLQILSINDALEVHNHTTEFVATYSQLQNEPLRRFGFSLFDQNMRLIQQFPNQQPPAEWVDIDGGASAEGGWGHSFQRLAQMVGRFDKNRAYFIRVSIETVNGMTWQHTQNFTAHFLEPTGLGVVNARPIEEEGFIRITARLEQVRGTIDINNPNAIQEPRPLIRYSPAIAMLDSTPYKELVDSELKNEEVFERRLKFNQAVENGEHITFAPRGNIHANPPIIPEWIIIPDGQKLVVRQVTFGAAMVMHGQLVGGRCRNGEIIMVIRTPEESPQPMDTFTFRHYFHNGRRKIVCTKDNNTGHKAMYTSNSIQMPENMAWHLNIKFDWQRMSLRIHNANMEVPTE